MVDSSLDQSLAYTLTTVFVADNHIFDPVFVTCKGRATCESQHAGNVTIFVNGGEQSKTTFLQEPVHPVSVDGAEGWRKFMQKKIDLLLHVFVYLMYRADSHALCLWKESLLDKLLGDLDSVCRSTLAEVVGYAPEIET